MMFAMALAPLITASVWSATGSPRAVWMLIFAGSLVGTGGYAFAVFSRWRLRQHAATAHDQTALAAVHPHDP